MTVDEPIFEDDVFGISPLLCQKVLNILKTGQGVIIDHVITSERIYKQLTETLREYKLIKVQTKCPLKELKRREKERKNRYVGSAEASYEYLFPKEGSDLMNRVKTEILFAMKYLSGYNVSIKLFET